MPLGVNSMGFGHGPAMHGPFGHGAWCTFSQTPGYIFAEDMTYAVDVQRFDDLTEQRFLTSRELGLTLTYDFSRTDSATQGAVASWYIAAGGPATRFVAVDHRTGASHVVRFLEDFAMGRGPGLLRSGPAVRLKVLRDA